MLLWNGKSNEEDGNYMKRSKLGADLIDYEHSSPIDNVQDPFAPGMERLIIP